MSIDAPTPNPYVNVHVTYSNASWSVQTADGAFITTDVSLDAAMAAMITLLTDGSIPIVLVVGA